MGIETEVSRIKEGHRFLEWHIIFIHRIQRSMRVQNLQYILMTYASMTNTSVND